MSAPFRASPAQLFTVLCSHGLGIDEALAQRCWGALSQSPHPKATAVQLLFTGYRGSAADFPGWIFYRLSPTMLVEAVETLCEHGQLTRPEATMIDEAIFAAMDSSEGHHHEWK